MENSFDIGKGNRYALFLDDDSDPLDVLKAQEQAKELKKKTKEAEKENKGKPESKPKAAGANSRKGIKETQNVKTQENKTAEPKAKGVVRPADRNAERPPPRRRDDRPHNGTVDNKDGAPRPPKREFGDRKPNFERRFNDNPEGGERRGPPRVPREPREPREGVPRGPRTFDSRGKREFDRRSGSEKTGVKPIDKREGGGAHNWGTHKDDLEELNKTNSDGDQTEPEKTEPPAAAGDAKDSDAERTAPVEEEPKELTLDEYKALRLANRQKPQYNLRKAGEGEDLSQWKNMIVLEKKKEGGDDDESDEEFDLSDYPQRVGRQKRVLGIEFTFNDASRRGGTAGGRGRGRGRGVPRPRGPREEPPPGDVAERRVGGVPPPRQSAPKVDDNKDFPSLG